jgi:hypothetical protein
MLVGVHVRQTDASILQNPDLRVGFVLYLDFMDASQTRVTRDLLNGVAEFPPWRERWQLGQERLTVHEYYVAPDREPMTHGQV